MEGSGDIPFAHGSGAPESESAIPCSGCKTLLNVHGFHPLDPVICPKCGATTLLPARIGSYELKRLLGEGSMGRVYLALDTALEREVAIKILRRNLASTPRMWAMLEREARAAAGIRNPNVVQIFTMGKTLGRPYIVMELVPSATLEKRCLVQRLSESEALSIGIGVMNGLRAALKSGLLHGDIKPANILITPKGIPKVVDFGLARLAGQEKSVERWGTPYYIAPEKAAQKQEDHRSDQYSLGATLFHCLSGHAPFEGDSGETVIAKSLQEPTPWIRDQRPDISESCADILYRMMQRDPNRRFPSYEAAMQAMRDTLEGTYQPGGWEGAYKKSSESLFQRIRRAWNGEDRMHGG